jgi:hypothetical protein
MRRESSTREGVKLRLQAGALPKDFGTR